MACILNFDSIVNGDWCMPHNNNNNNMNKNNDDDDDDHHHHHNDDGNDYRGSTRSRW
eukprot:COSAG05_NODE_340_length_11109_cov_150.755041_12_plen_56_part_01